MPNRTELEAALWSILDALRPYAEDMLLIGGWAPYLHLTYGRAAEEGARTSLTAEADLVVPGRLPRGERPPVAEILEGAGYHRLVPGTVEPGDRAVLRRRRWPPHAFPGAAPHHPSPWIPTHHSPPGLVGRQEDRCVSMVFGVGRSVFESCSDHSSPFLASA
jgi:hypothetical protein